MGMNYYLKKKIKYDPATYDTYPSCGNSAYDNHIITLENGYLLNDHYYKTLSEITTDNFTIVLHIGKASYGWNFLLCSYPTLNITTLDDWIREFNDPNNIIINEDKEICSPTSMLQTIVDREPGLIHSTAVKFFKTYDIIENPEFS